MTVLARQRRPQAAPAPRGPGLLRGLEWLWDHTLNSVKFGILLMVLLALYVAVGSTFSGLRAWFEMSDMAFFKAWPMFVLAMLLVTNLLVVTFDRIPFTPPRYGVWTVHTGIVLLVFGMVYYFSNKVEGLALVRVGETVDYYYDGFERSLYVKADRRKAEPIPLKDLPRFAAYAPQLGNADYLARQDGLSGIEPTLRDYDPATRTGVAKPLAKVLGLPGDEPLAFDVLAYYPYAVVGATYSEADAGKTGLKLTLRDPQTAQERVQWMVAGDQGQEEETIATLRLKHLNRDDSLTGESLLQAAQSVNNIKWSVRGQSGEFAVEPGQSRPLGDTGYTVEATEFLPAFPLFGTGEPTDTLELLVHPPADAPFPKTFRRYILDAKATQTDFIPGVAGAGPKGKRQDKPVDADLVLNLTHSDGLNLLPRGGETERHTFLTKPDDKGLWQVVASNTAPAALHYDADGTLPLRIDGQVTDPATGRVTPRSLELDVERVAHVARQEWVQEVPPELRDRKKGEGGGMQVLTVRASRGDWQQIVQVPYSPWPDQAPWSFGVLNLPGTDKPVQLQLGNTRRQMPASVTLDSFELVPYAGDFTSDSAMRDFKSHLTLKNLGSGEKTDAIAHLNNPVYLDYKAPAGLASLLPGQSWLFYQNQWDPEGQKFTVLGVGNRPAITTMIVGCCLIVLGTLYAFYAKPLIVRRMKANALAAHAAGAEERKAAKSAKKTQSRRRDGSEEALAV